MQIKYNLEEKDLKAFQHYALKKNSTVKRLNVFNYLTVLAISYWQLIYQILFADFVRNFDLNLFLFYFVSGTITFGFLIAISKAVSYLANLYAINSHVKKHHDGDGILGEHLIRFEENHLVEITDVNETQHSWKAVDRIEENQDYIFIYASPVNVHVIPKRFFPDHETSSLFVDEAKRLMDIAKTNFSSSYLASRA